MTHMNTNDSSPRTAAPSAASSSGLRQRKSSANPKICDESKVSLPRLVNRNFPYHQSANRIAVVNEKHHSHIWPLLLRDWFHVLMRMPTFGSILFLLVIWTSVILIFAGIYVKIDQYNVGMDCGLGDPGAPIAWGTSFAFSLETCTTVGYGLPGSTNAFFEANCPEVQIAIYAQMTWSMMFNAFLFAFFYSVLSRCENRSSQLVFSKKLCIGTRGEKVFAWSRCYDIDASYPVVEPHVRMYVMDNKMQMHVLRIQQPNDDTGGMLYTSLPVEVHHHIDNHSVLSPRQMPLVEDSHGLVLRTADSLTANREEIVCPVCGEAYGTYERLWKHIQYNRVVEERDDYPHESSHLGFAMPDITPISLEEVKTHFEQHISEIVVVVEGIDPQVSGTFQSLQSYKYEDIAWAGEFEPCLSVRSNKFCVDFAKFHEVRLPDQSNSSNIEEKDVEAAAANNSGDEAEEVIENGEHHDLAC